MGIGGVTSINSNTGMQTATASSAKPKIKNIQNEITGVQQQMQALSSEEGLSANEKITEKKKLQKEISGLNTELKQRQEELRKSQQREIRIAELQEDSKPAKEENTEDKVQAGSLSPDAEKEKNLPADSLPSDRQGSVISKNNDGTVLLKDELNPQGKTGIGTEKKQAAEKEETAAEKEAAGTNRNTDAEPFGKEMRSVVSADISVQQAQRQGTVITRIRNGIAILKGEIGQNEKYGSDTETRKPAELETMEKKEQRAMAFQFSALSEANNTINPTEKTSAAGTQNGMQINQSNQKNNNIFANAFHSSEESLAFQQNFHVSLGN